ncbi:hypothetical protein JXK06_00095 [Patescibacteria group bacterium]|nr:hypothetical protein [Patescibacteria group bacterium]
MENNRKKIGIALIILGLIIIALIIYFGFVKKEKEELVIIETPVVQNPIVSEPELGTPSDAPRSWQPNLNNEDPHTFNETDLEKRAKAFAERFGSYSNQSNYSNFSDLEIFMTKSFADWSKSYVEELRDNAPSYKTYYGITTRALGVEIIDFDESKGRAEINVLTERSESSDNINNLEPYQQEITLKFNKIGSDWLVDAAYWEKR